MSEEKLGDGEAYFIDFGEDDEYNTTRDKRLLRRPSGKPLQRKHAAKPGLELRF